MLQNLGSLDGKGFQKMRMVGELSTMGRMEGLSQTFVAYVAIDSGDEFVTCRGEFILP